MQTSCRELSDAKVSQLVLQSQHLACSACKYSRQVSCSSTYRTLADMVVRYCMGIETLHLLHPERLLHLHLHALHLLAFQQGTENASKGRRLWISSAILQAITLSTMLPVSTLHMAVPSAVFRWMQSICISSAVTAIPIMLQSCFHPMCTPNNTLGRHCNLASLTASTFR